MLCLYLFSSCIKSRYFSVSFCSSQTTSSLPDWAVPQSSRLKYRQLFNSHDKMMSGHLTGIYTHTHTLTLTLLVVIYLSVLMVLWVVVFSALCVHRSSGSHYPDAVQSSSGSAGLYMVSTMNHPLKLNNLILIRTIEDIYTVLNFIFCVLICGENPYQTFSSNTM